jgi:hypothetical protein
MLAILDTVQSFGIVAVQSEKLVSSKPLWKPIM